MTAPDTLVFDLLFAHVCVVTMDKDARLLSDAFVGISGGRVSYVDTTPPTAKAARVIDGRDHVLMPGMTNAHAHLPMTLLRGYADDCALQPWLFEKIFPVEDRMDAEAIRVGTLLALSEALASGTTSISDMYNFSEEIARAIAETGIKANVARGVTCPGDFNPKTHVGLQETIALYDAYHGFDNGRILVDASFHAEYTSPPTLWRYMAEWARERNLRMHVHLSETRREHEECMTNRGVTPTAAFQAAGVFDGPVTVAHGVWITDADIDILAAHNVALAHCPVSNAKLASGIAPVSKMLQKGLSVALGTDGAASNNTLSMFDTLKSASLHAKLQTMEPTALPARDALRLLIQGGARAQGRETQCGVVAPGFDADLILLDFTRPHFLPRHNVESHLVYAATGGDVALTMVRGVVLYERGVYPTIDQERLRFDLDRVLARLF